MNYPWATDRSRFSCSNHQRLSCRLWDLSGGYFIILNRPVSGFNQLVLPKTCKMRTDESSRLPNFWLNYVNIRTKFNCNCNCDRAAAAAICIPRQNARHFVSEKNKSCSQWLLIEKNKVVREKLFTNWHNIKHMTRYNKLFLSRFQMHSDPNQRKWK